MAGPSAIARQLDRCDICGRKVHKKDLVRTNIDALAVGGSNYLIESSYGTSWTIATASDAGAISSGPYADVMRVSIDDSNNTTEVFGSQTWSGSGVLRSNTAIDASTWTSLVFVADMGPYDRETSPEISFKIGLCDSDGSNKEQYGLWLVNSSTRAWFTFNIADTPVSKSSNALHFYISATAVGKKWWVDRMQVIKDATHIRDNAFIPTTGAAVDRVDTPIMLTRKVCDRHREELLSKSERYGRIAEQRSDEPIAVDIQEV